MFRSTILALTMAAATLASAQTQMPNAVKIGNEGITITSIPATAVVQLGTSAAPGVWAAPVSIPAGSLPLLVSCASGCPSVLSSSDPDPGVVKEIDAQQTSTAYTVVYTNTTGTSQTLTVPALASTSSGGTTFTPGTVYPTVFSNIQAVTGSPAVPVLSLFGVQPFTMVGGVLSNFNWTMTINGITFNCTFGALSATAGTASVNCIVPTTNTQ
jgi:hypothetical protein